MFAEAGQSRFDGSAGAFPAFLPVLVERPSIMDEIEQDKFVGRAAVLQSGKSLFHAVHVESPSSAILTASARESIA